MIRYKALNLLKNHPLGFERNIQDSQTLRNIKLSAVLDQVNSRRIARILAELPQKYHPALAASLHLQAEPDREFYLRQILGADYKNKITLAGDELQKKFDFYRKDLMQRELMNTGGMDQAWFKSPEKFKRSSMVNASALYAILKEIGQPELMERFTLTYDRNTFALTGSPFKALKEVEAAFAKKLGELYPETITQSDTGWKRGYLDMNQAYNGGSGSVSEAIYFSLNPEISSPKMVEQVSHQKLQGMLLLKCLEEEVSHQIAIQSLPQ